MIQRMLNNLRGSEVAIRKLMTSNDGHGGGLFAAKVSVGQLLVIVGIVHTVVAVPVVSYIINNRNEISEMKQDEALTKGAQREGYRRIELLENRQTSLEISLHGLQIDNKVEFAKLTGKVEGIIVQIQTIGLGNVRIDKSYDRKDR